MDKKIRSKIQIAWKKAQDKAYPCFFLDCSRSAINSHSQSKANSLGNIEENGHLIKTRKDPLNNKLTINDMYEEIGVKQASVFRGFCEKHDNDLFREIDRVDDSDFSSDNLLKLSFRTFANEVRVKQKMAYFFEQLFDDSGTSDAYYFYLGIKNNLQVTAPYYQRIFEKLLLGETDKMISGIIYRCRSPLPIATATVFDPTLVDESNVVDGNLNEPLKISFLNVIPQKQGGLIIFTFFVDDKSYVEKFLEENLNFESAIFNHCEEFLMRPSFFYGLSDKFKKQIVLAQRAWDGWKKQNMESVLNLDISEKIEI